MTAPLQWLVEQPSEGEAGPIIYAPTGRKPHGRTVQEIEQRADLPAPGLEASSKEKMTHRLETKQGRGTLRAAQANH
jgi:hypothetical protein